MVTVSRTARIRLGSILAAATVAIGVGLALPATANAAPVTKTITVDAKTAGSNGVFADSGVVAVAGAPITVSATGTATYDPTITPVGPNGRTGVVCGSPSSPCVIGGQNYVALIGKVGTAAPVLVGAGPTILSGTGPVTFAINDNINGYFNNSGSFTVTLTYTPPCTGIFCFGS